MRRAPARFTSSSHLYDPCGTDFGSDLTTTKAGLLHSLRMRTAPPSVLMNGGIVEELTCSPTLPPSTPGGDRTHDCRLKRPLLCHLSYRGLSPARTLLIRAGLRQTIGQCSCPMGSPTSICSNASCVPHSEQISVLLSVRDSAPGYAPGVALLGMDSLHRGQFIVTPCPVG